MPDKRSKYDTDPLDPDFVRRTEEMSGRTNELGGETRSVPTWPDPAANEPTRRFDEQMADSYPSVFVPPQYQAPPPQPFTTFGVGVEPHQPPATVVPPGPASAYPPPAGAAKPSNRKVEKLGLGENIATVLPYAPFYIGLVAAAIELLIVPRQETRTRFHAAQGLALQLAILAVSFILDFVRLATGSGFGASIFGLAALVFLIFSMWRVWEGKPHHIAPLDDAAAWLNERLKPIR